MADVPAKLNEAAAQVETNAEVDLKQVFENALDAKISALEAAEAEAEAAAAAAEAEAEALMEDYEELLEEEEEEEEEEMLSILKSRDPSVEVEVLVSGDVDMETTE